jgi:hypothetical protein
MKSKEKKKIKEEDGLPARALPGPLGQAHRAATRGIDRIDVPWCSGSAAAGGRPESRAWRARPPRWGRAALPGRAGQRTRLLPSYRWI